MKIEITFHGLADIIRSILAQTNEQIAEQETRFHRSAITEPPCEMPFDATDTVEQPAIDDSFDPAELEKEPPTPTEAPKPAPIKLEPITIDEVRKMLTEFMNTKGRDKTVELLKSYGLQSLTQASDKPDVLSQIAAAIKGAI